MQRHTVDDCPNVDVKDRSQLKLFWKHKDSTWSIVDKLLEDTYPEAIEIIKASKKYQTSPDKLIKNYEFVTFHQSFTYEDFVEGIKPKLSEEEGRGDIEYEIADGIFKKMALRAKEDPENNYAIFIDEINRGNIAAIFGELITLIEEDKRAGNANAISVKLPYSKENFEVPSNLYLIGTMNTADRSIEALDSALRRRFSFKEMAPQPELIDKLLKENAVWNGISISAILNTINKRISVLIDRDHCIGHSYFLRLKNYNGEAFSKEFKKVFDNNITPLLQEYFFNDFTKIGMVLGQGFINSETVEEHLFANFEDSLSDDYMDSKTYEFKKAVKMNDEDFKEALESLLGY